MEWWYGLTLGAVGGLFGTVAMSAIEVIPWRRWGLTGVFEWHENQMLIVKFLKSSHDPSLCYLGIFGLHLTNGPLDKWPIRRDRILSCHRFHRFLGNSASATSRNSIRFLLVDRYIGSNS
jgi:hypothetical protein